MRETFSAERNGIRAVFGVSDEGGLLLLHLGTAPFTQIDDYVQPFQYASFRAAEVQIAGRHHDEGHGTKNMGTSEGKAFRYRSHAFYERDGGGELVIELESDVLESRLSYFFFDGCRCVRTRQTVINRTDRALPLEYVSSFALYGLEKFNPEGGYGALELGVSYNSSYRENQWKTYALADLGFVSSSRWSTTVQKVCFSNTGTWSCKQHLPEAYLYDRATGQYMLWEIAAHASWSWEIGDYNNNLYLVASGPNETENQWIKLLAPGERFESTPVTLAFSDQGLDDLFGQMTICRRAIRLPGAVKERLSLIYNPYMHDMGNYPTEESVARVAEGVKDLGLDCLCIDAGWHDEGDFWKSIGDWEESRERFPNGLTRTLEVIRACGMKPGLWLEIQNMGFFNPHRGDLPDECYFCRSGGVIANNGRVTMDFSHPAVRRRADEILDRIVRDYRPAYLKFDYNADAGAGTDARAESVGEGLRRHAEAYADWLESLAARYPEIEIENCNCGGLGLDPVMLRIAGVHSTSDQTDYLLTPYIAGNMLTNGTPEQMGVWCYPLEGQDEEAVIMNVVSTLLGRMHLSGKTYLLGGAHRDLVREGLAYHRKIEEDKRRALPFWPLGLNKFGSDLVAAGIRAGERAYLAVWNLGEARTVKIPFPEGVESVRMGYPADFRGADCRIGPDGRSAEISFTGRQARLLEISIRKNEEETR